MGVCMSYFRDKTRFLLPDGFITRYAIVQLYCLEVSALYVALPITEDGSFPKCK